MAAPSWSIGTNWCYSTMTIEKRDIPSVMTQLGESARAAGARLATTTGEERNAALEAAAAALRERSAQIIEAN